MTNARDYHTALIENPRFNAWNRNALAPARVLHVVTPSDADRCPLQLPHGATDRAHNPRYLDHLTAHSTSPYSSRW